MILYDIIGIRLCFFSLECGQMEGKRGLTQTQFGCL